MARSALFALVTLTSLTYVASQTTPSPTVAQATGASTFPATPLASLSFSYDQIVRIFSL
jgi:hypothetical protein